MYNDNNLLLTHLPYADPACAFLYQLNVPARHILHLS